MHALLDAPGRKVTPEQVQHWLDALSAPGLEAHLLGLHVWQWLGLAVFLLAAFLVGTVLQWLFLLVMRALARRTPVVWDDRLVNASPGPLRFALAALILFALLPLLSLPDRLHAGLNLAIRTALIVIGAWVLLRLSSLAAAVLEAYLAQQTSDANLQRSIRTQINAPLRVLRFLIVVLAVALVLVQFEVVQTVGLSMLASAGVAGVVVGLAAQRTVANLLAGIQLAVFEPMRIGDTVVVEGEQGWVEEISLTYVIIKLWDERRLILPVSYFLEKPFQNWTRKSAEMLGTVTLRTNFKVPVEEVRQQLKRIVEQTALWDRRVQRLQVTDVGEKSVELRVLVSAADGAQLWELRCYVREKLLEWLQTHGQAYFPA